MAIPGEKFYIDARGVKAQGVVTENGFTLLKGSEIRPKIAAYLSKALVELRHKCESDGTIVDWEPPVVSRGITQVQLASPSRENRGRCGAGEATQAKPPAQSYAGARRVSIPGEPVYY